ncbi:peptidoglycan DD-metalloendopeptidase family protein [Deinococcus hohokamensis]|uniref:Peptidoglycan DD-metalloendopeptidase family protein n=1 Tax=Deinococcus hohokamensis TaxID=309883 RepID=A0ABV9IAE0_9DEIO
MKGGARRPLLGLLLGTLLLGAAAQTTSGRLEELQRELQQQRQQSAAQAQALEALRSRIANLSSQQRETLARLDALAGSVTTLENEVAVLNARTDLAERALQETAAQRQATEARVAQLQGDVRQILNAMYRERSGRYLQLLSQARSLSDLLIRVQYSNLAGEYNTRVIETLRGEVQVLQTQQAQQEAQAKALRDVQAQRASTLAQLRTRRQEQARLLAGLRASEQGQRTLAAQTQAEQALTARSIDQLVGQVVAERQRLEEERRRRLEEERRRREEEQRRLREAQERARQEALRLARLREAQERAARELAQRRAEAALAARRQAQAAQRQAQAAAQAAEQRRAEQQLAAQAAAQRARAQQVQQEQAALAQRREQVQQEQTRVEAALAPLPAPSGPLGFPISPGQVSSPYGSGGAQWTVLQGPDNAQAVAVQGGDVLAATYYASLGWVVLLEHPSTVTVYLGLRDPQVQAGQRVAQGTPLGLVGGSPVFGPGRMAFQLNRVQGGSRQPVAPGF